MSVAVGSRFARELPEMAIPWRAEEFPAPMVLVLNEQLARDLGFDPAQLRTDEGARLLTGNLVPEGAAPVAQAYSGHQFGWYSPRLGDGRALLIGELTRPGGGLVDLHLKGSGPTPFARGGDGFAALAPMLREHLISEAMHALNIPTTRSLAVTTTGGNIHRSGLQSAAVLARIASSHLRVGSFQYAAATGDSDLLRRLTDHAIDRHHPAAASAENTYLALLDSVIRRQAELIAAWMHVGFIHGVMNTDNMTISGETIDFGPCAFMDAFDPQTVFSSIDETGRYAYRNQPLVAEWNLARFAESLLPLLAQDQEEAVKLAEASLGRFREHYSATWTQGMRAKLGLPGRTPADAATVADAPQPAPDEASTLIADLFPILQAHAVDYTSFFRALSAAARGDEEPVRSLVAGAGADDTDIDGWLRRWRTAGPDPALMDRTNPVYVPRNHLVEEALEAATTGDLDPFTRLLDLVTSPYTERPGAQRYAAPAPEGFGPYRTFCGT
ncbi:protein adenylyltransferase SelO family protein [Brevibacterium sp.]|uniref:protein adenylyltransferase SelO n=1 Tax=Brevibacterium sp. TaxID=1701 RepID=UPI002811BE19|nr:YdiU family protein [Brevibacterium sp.]